MKLSEFPLIISPNLGCSEIISVEELENGKTIPLIVACQYGEFSSPVKEIFEGRIFLQRSDGKSAKIPVKIMNEPKEIKDWNVLSKFSNLQATKEIINNELHYNVFGEETTYWRIEVSIEKNNNSLLRKKNEKYLPTLYDLVLTDKSNKLEKVNYHSVQFVQNFKKNINFIHLTDPHIAKRNDEILDEVLKKKNKRNREDIKRTYNNFNDKFREFVKKANVMADKGELDFIMITGDLVDFAFHGWENEPNIDENNWKTFINIVTGADKEIERIKVAIYTSTGNHDWRLHPYDPLKYSKKIIFRKKQLKLLNEKFGLYFGELKNYEYKNFDSSEYPEDRRAKLSNVLMNDAYRKLNIQAFEDKWYLRFTSMISTKLSTSFLTIFGALLGNFGFSLKMNEKIYSYITLAITGVFAIFFYIINWIFKKLSRNFVDFIIDNPFHAEGKALHHYLKHINPYFDYAFQYGGHSFIVMDTGVDVVVRNFLDGKGIKDISKLSIRDNIIGFSPDSMAFDSTKDYYNWSQIVWLEKVLSIPEKKNFDENGDNRSFIFLHAPPINPPKNIEWSNLWESNRQSPKWIPKDECNLTYGSINHYLSQFYYLCMGYRESELIGENVSTNHKIVDIVFSGHAHKNIEFRLEKEWNKVDKKHDIKIYSDVYSELFGLNNSDEWWEEKRPFVIQTAACGLKEESEPDPPYFRKVTLDNKGKIIDFKVRNIDGIINFN